MDAARAGYREIEIGDWVLLMDFVKGGGPVRLESINMIRKVIRIDKTPSDGFVHAYFRGSPRDWPIWMLRLVARKGNELAIATAKEKFDDVGQDKRW